MYDMQVFKSYIFATAFQIMKNSLLLIWCFKGCLKSRGLNESTDTGKLLPFDPKVTRLVVRYRMASPSSGATMVS